MSRVSRLIPGALEDSMPYVVLAAGALMTIAGFYAVVTGYGVVQLEQGWSAVISGATLIAGGVVTMAMAPILRVLLQIKATLSGTTHAAMSSLAPEAAATTPTHPVAPPIVEPIPVPALAAADVAAPNLPAQKLPAEELPAREPPTRELPAPNLYESPSLTSALAPVAPPPPPVRVAVADDTIEAKPAASIERAPPQAVHDEVAALEHDPYEPEQPAPAPAADLETPAMDDWLDRAFADLDEVRPIPSRSEPTRHEPVAIEESAPEHPVPDHASAAPTAREPAQAGMPASAPLVVATEPEPVAQPQPEPTSAVIGRYEADGTSYTMYADGSIEAQSEAGVYRFASMAELKSFIET